MQAQDDGELSASRALTRIELSVSTIQGQDRTHATFTAHVTPLQAGNGQATPGGSVSFMNGERSIGSAFLDAEGGASLTVNALPPGLQKIAAVYNGDSSYQSSTSSAAEVNSEASGVQAFTLSANPSAVSVTAGGTVSTVITATPENGFNQAVSLSCSGVPYVSVACSFSPSPVTPGPITPTAPNGTPAISTLSISTQAPSGALHLPGEKSGKETVYAIAFPGILALVGLGLARKRDLYGKYSGAARMMGLLVLLAAGGIGLGACSQRYHYYHRPPAGNPGTPVGAYTVVISGITGAGSNLATGTVNVTLTVK